MRATAVPIRAAEEIHMEPVLDGMPVHVQGRIHEVPHGHRDHGLEHEVARTELQREKQTTQQLHSAINFLQSVDVKPFTPSSMDVTSRSSPSNPLVHNALLHNTLTDTPRSVIEAQIKYAERHDQRLNRVE